MLGIVRAHAPWRVRAAGASGHAPARIVHCVIGLLHRVVRLRLDHCHHVSAYGGNSGAQWQAQRVCLQRVCAACAAAEVASAFEARVRARSALRQVHAVAGARAREREATRVAQRAARTDNLNGLERPGRDRGRDHGRDQCRPLKKSCDQKVVHVSSVILVNVSSLALPPSLSQSVSQ